MFSTAFDRLMPFQQREAYERMEEERDKYRAEASVLTFERDKAIDALMDVFALMPPERVRLLHPDTTQLVGLVQKAREQ